MKSALVLIFDNFEETEGLAPVDILRRGGIKTISAALGEKRNVVGRSGIEVWADAVFDSVRAETFDAVAVCGGKGVFDWLDDDALAYFLRRHSEGGKTVAAICAAPLLLFKIGLLDGKKRTSHFSVAEKIGSCLDTPVVRDGNIITSRGAGTAIEFGLEILASFDPKVAKDVAKDICFVK